MKTVKNTLKRVSERAIKKTAGTTVDSIGNKIADRITFFKSFKSLKNSSKANTARTNKRCNTKGSIHIT